MPRLIWLSEPGAFDLSLGQFTGSQAGPAIHHGGVRQQAMAQELLEKQVSIVAETNSNALPLSASPRFFTQVKSLIEHLDQPQLQVLIQVLLAEVTLDATSELGVDWAYPNPRSMKSAIAIRSIRAAEPMRRG